jgi:basic membrane lipoprotein Med (substrate-binding protein (PBP1-ABC) superfamily)/DNA-binding SARP family transcriptional activator/class 3 adenylate cyclase
VDGYDKAFRDRGEIKTFLIADIRGYTAFTEEHGDVAAGRLAARFAAITREVAEGRSGTLLELRGDEALVTFDSARQAIRAAVDLQARFVDETVSDPTLPLAVGIGLDAGEGVPVEGGYRGSGLNRASRLCALAGPGEILASGEVVHLAGKVPGATFTARGDLNVKGAMASLHLIAVSSETKPAPARMAPFAPSLRTVGTPGGSLRFCVLGPLEVFGPPRGSGPGAPDGRLVELGPPKQRAVLAILLMRLGEIVPNERLIELVWGEHPPRTAGHSIQIYTSELRKTLEPVAGRRVIITRPPGYLLEADADSIDARQFERLVAEGARSLGAGDPARAAATLGTALRLWRGQPLADFAYEEFAQAEIRRLQELRLNAIENLSQAQLAVEAAPEVLPMLETAIREDPLRERLREVQMLALYRSGRHPDALRAYQDFRQLLADELGLDPSPALQRLQERILLHDPSLRPETGQLEPRTTVRNPYKGLRPFSEEDAEDFFGRGALVHQLLESLAKGVPLLAAVGPSGSGKSSAVAAGLIPALRSGAIDGSEDWVVAHMQPGINPFGELAAALLRALGPKHSSLEGRFGEDQASPIVTAVQALPVGRRLVLLIDQFEELFTMEDERSRERFIGELVTAVGAPRTPAQAVICLRADFYDRPLMHAEFARVLIPGVVNVLPMMPPEIEEAVVEPARRAGVEVEPGLLAEMTADTVHQPGGLPLLQYALTELFEQRAGGALTLESYRGLGGIRGALSRRADEVFGHLDAESRGVAVQLFLRLVRIQDRGAPVRRRLPISDLTALELDPVVLSNVLDSFGRSRLLSFDRDATTGNATVEVAHDALLTEWERLAGWIEDHRDDLQRHETLASAAQAWETAGRDPDFLLTGSRLTDHEDWSRATDMRLTANERAFLDAGLNLRRRQETEEAERLHRQRRLERRARRRLVALVAALAILAAGTTYGILAWPGSRVPDVAMVFEGPGDAGPNDLMIRGFRGAVSEFGISAETRAVPNEQMGAEVRRLTERGVDLIVAPLLCDSPLNAIAADHPDTRFILQYCVGPDRPNRPDRPNVSVTEFATEEGSYLMGAAAALKSESHIVGFVGGQDVPLIWRFHAGFKAGAKAVDSDVRVVFRYLTSWRDLSGFDSPTLGTQAAEELYAKGADVIFHAAGFSGIGVFEAARDQSVPGRKLWAIGVDTDQYRAIAAADLTGVNAAALRQHILTSLLIRYDRAVFKTLEEYTRGTLKAGRLRFALADEAMEIAYSGGFIDNVRDTLERLERRIIAGEIQVPSRPCERKEKAANWGLPPSPSCA